jgi:hypothetical protein
MADISIQFFAMPLELLDFVRQFIRENGLYVVRITFPPYDAKQVPVDLLADIFTNVERPPELAFTLTSPSIPPKGSQTFCAQNPDALHLDIGSYDKKGLKESCLSARTANPAALAVWKQIAARLRRITKSGAKLANSETSDTRIRKWYRFTNGAIELHRAGTRLLSLNGIELAPTASPADVKN